ncbi:plasmid partitioning protein RepB C-terminal domain-containing protein [Falsirhodobacter halotolerans]|uniref:plasmid partitioning protein RepB C-terminal domain-containing protein n=1 Tax=Falsirhodobacter halotolerans TaxID=1146892 RepID=UPI001FD0EAE0|nr:plasmid partitioning protein RepB C-terminal domain-containing protein [Falsirhodobacter halotolerans]MCJ8140075.1 ParB N-terminal domain-containing protein [Falsirhodobacter halotolerans]
MTHMGKMPPPKNPGFEANLRTIPIDAILPVKQLPVTVTKSQKYGQIAASIREVGLIEPPVVARAAGQDGSFILLDGHVRLHVLKELGETTVTCLVATDDESFTYNKRISCLATIQEHKMILRAVERGVSEARIAAALNVNIALIRQKRTLLNGICPEAAELLKARHCPINSFRSLRKMKPLRQIQAAELMIAANNYTVPYVEAILAASDATDLVDPTAKKPPAGVTREQAERMKAEMANLQKNIKLIEGTLGPDHLRLVVAGRYVERLLKNDRLARYLDKNHGEILGEFRQIVAGLAQPAPTTEARSSEAD